MTSAGDISMIYETYARKVTNSISKTPCIIHEENSTSQHSQVAKINIFIKTPSGTIENRYSAEVSPGSVTMTKGTTTIIGTDSKLKKSIQVVISKDMPTSVIVQSDEGDHPDLVRFQNDLSFFQRDDPTELNIFINE